MMNFTTQLSSDRMAPASMLIRSLRCHIKLFNEVLDAILNQVSTRRALYVEFALLKLSVNPLADAEMPGAVNTIETSNRLSRMTKRPWVSVAVRVCF